MHLEPIGQDSRGFNAMLELEWLRWLKSVEHEIVDTEKDTNTIHYRQTGLRQTPRSASKIITTTRPHTE